MIDSKVSYTRESLRAAIVEWFGEDARFHTCSVKDMPADELIALLSVRSKFFSDTEGFRVNEDEICDDA